jgi:hypothetical protein
MHSGSCSKFLLFVSQRHIKRLNNQAFTNGGCANATCTWHSTSLVGIYLHIEDLLDET